MAYKTGGKKGLKAAIKAKTVCTIEVDNKIQISGIIDSYTNQKNTINYIKTSGPTQLCYKNKEIRGHNKNYHRDGYSTPIGKIKKYNKSINQLTKKELKEIGIMKNKQIKLMFNSGIEVHGLITNIIKKKSKIILITFSNCTVKNKHKILFHPNWGSYDMICGQLINSIYGGPCDKKNYYLEKNKKDKYLKYNKPQLTTKNNNLNNLHKKINELRVKNCSYKKIENIYLEAIKKFPKEWLIFYELLELSIKNHYEAYWVKDIVAKLKRIIKRDNDLSHAIKRGLDLIRFN